MEESDRLKDIVRSRINDLKVAELQRIEDEELEKLHEVNEKKQRVSNFIQGVIPFVTEHFSKSSDPLTVFSELSRNFIEFLHLNRQELGEYEEFKIIDEVDYDNYHEFFLEGDLSRLELGNGDRILLDKILDEDLRKIFFYDLEDDRATHWEAGLTLGVWAFFYGSKNASYGRREYHRILITKLDRGKLRKIGKYRGSDLRIHRLAGRFYITFSESTSYDSPPPHLHYHNPKQERFATYLIGEDELERIVNIYIDLNDDYEFELIVEFFSEHGLFVERINSRYSDSRNNWIADYRSLSLSIDADFEVQNNS